MRELTDEENAALTESIRKDGVQVPIILRKDSGEIIDGHNRQRIGAELNIPVPHRSVVVTGDDHAIRLGIELNRCRRQMTKRDRDEARENLRALGMSTRMIADQLGTSKETERRHQHGDVAPDTSGAGATSPDKVTGKDGKRYPAKQTKPSYRPTPTEAARLQDFCVDARARGYRMATIAEALDLGNSAVSKHIARGGGSSVAKTYTDPTEPLEPFDWRDPPAVTGPRTHHGPVPRIEPPVPYTVSTTLALLNSMLKECRNDNAINRFAGDISDALTAADEDWLERANTAVTDMDSYLHRLMGLLVDKGQRERAARNWSARNDLAPLHSVQAGA